jgi:tRNA dimethylallyltransferase
MAKNFSQQIVIISGATCTNKSKLALEFARQNNSAIINGDALQVYRDLKILSAQPSLEDQKLVDHHLYSCLDYQQKSNVASWLQMTKEVIEKIWHEQKLPIIVGGTGLYISKLIDGITKMPEISKQAKEQAHQLFTSIGFDEFQKRYGEDKIKDKQRLIRACEIFLSTNMPLSFWQQQSPQKIFPDAKFTHVNLNLDRKIIYTNCDQRLVTMLENGAIAEVENLIKKTNDDNLAICKTLGFIEIKAYLHKKISYQEMQKIIQQKTRNYAKRQLTWFRHQFEEINFFENYNLAKDFLQKKFVKFF